MCIDHKLELVDDRHFTAFRRLSVYHESLAALPHIKHPYELVPISLCTGSSTGAWRHQGHCDQQTVSLGNS
jgi:hypothetical protein